MSLPKDTESGLASSERERINIEKENRKGIEKLYQSRERGNLNRSREPGSRPTSFRSYGDGNGYISFEDHEKEPSADQAATVKQEKSFEVQWDDDHDPLNPRSFSTARKWLIILILSMSSSCVYVHTTVIVSQLEKLIVIGLKHLCFEHVHIYLCPDYQGISLLTDRCHPRSLALRYR